AVTFRTLPRFTRAIIASTIAAGLLGAAMVSLPQPQTHMTPLRWVVAGVVCGLIFYSWVWPLVLFRRNQSQAFQFDEGFFVVLALLTPARVTVSVFAVAVVMAQAVKRRALFKSAFNLGEVLLSVSLAATVSRTISSPAAHIGGSALIGAATGAAVYFIVTTSMVSAVLVSLDVPWQECTKDLLPQAVLSTAGTLVGLLLTIDIQADRWAVALVVPVLIVLRILITGQFKAQHDRARMQGLFNLTLDANRGLQRETVLDTVLDAVRVQLRCPEAELTTGAPQAAQVAAPIEIAGRQHWLVASGRRREEPFDEADRMLLDAIAAIAKGALTNAELYSQVRYERSRLASITLNIAEGVCAVDSDGDLTFVNPAAADLIQLPARSVAMNEPVGGGPVRAPDFLLRPARAVMESGGISREEETFFEGRDGLPVQVAYTASAMRQNGEVVGAVIAFRDITERKKLEATMTRQALYDSLTGLANRRLLVERLESAIVRSSGGGAAHALVFVDVDRFKAINDSLGHVTGDALLVAVGARLRQALGPAALVARFGGDEFVVLVEGVNDPDEAGAVARRICAAVEEPLVLDDGYEIVASLSVGIALTEPGQSADDALRNADVAMYKAKERGGSYQLFDRELMGTRSSERIDLEAALRKAIDRGELELYYQPLVSLADQQIVGAEGLVRWHHPTEGLIGPERFVTMAEETGLILPIGNLVLRQACQEIQAVRRRLGVNLPISVNLSPRQFQQSNLLADVATALDRAGLPSDLLKIEITETMVMDDLGGATEIMKKLNRLGVKLAIDDFGTGHSSLGYVKNFPVHEVKVDRMFVSNLAHDPVDSAIVKAVVDLAGALGITAVAEGVETKEQLQGLKKLGCQVGQGFLFSPPLPVTEFDELIDRHFRPGPAQQVVRRAGLRAL
ncbi:MAG TPA: EAL domain-containing protein, partial [Acidimicrobiales bacterium]|nr:EAL domain-containing protein [Acidimicrobiales bacterium]